MKRVLLGLLLLVGCRHVELTEPMGGHFEDLVWRTTPVPFTLIPYTTAHWNRSDAKKTIGYI